MSLYSISPIDGRYKNCTDPLVKYFSEAALMRFRVVVEGEYLIALASTRGVGLRKLKPDEIKKIQSLYRLSPEDAQMISQIETKGYKGIHATDHDVKAVEYFIKTKLANTTLKYCLEWVHFGLTSYDVNTPARGMMLRDALELVVIPELEEIHKALENLAKKYKNVPMLARTHGQPASPTTFGKEIKVFSERIRKQLTQLKNNKISVKFSGATGNFNAHTAAYPNIDWVKFAKNFVAGLNKDRKIKLELNLPTTQIDPHDNEAEIFDNLRRINTILIGFNQDMWRYISDEWIVQKAVEGEVGSSAMPHKINPIKFENSEGNLGMANSLFDFFSRKLPISRLQRDLSDSTVERNFGSALAYCLIAYDNLLKGLSRISINVEKITEDLNSHPEVLAEAIQTVLRREGAVMPYEQLKTLTRGKKNTLQDLHAFIDDLKVSNEVKKELRKFTPENYIGLANKLTTL